MIEAWLKENGYYNHSLYKQEKHEAILSAYKNSVKYKICLVLRQGYCYANMVVKDRH